MPSSGTVNGLVMIRTVTNRTHILKADMMEKWSDQNDLRVIEQRGRLSSVYKFVHILSGGKTSP